MIKRVKLLILAVLFIFLLSNCANEEAVKLIDSSVKAGNLLTEYYDNLIKSVLETWELEAFNSSLREIDFPVKEQEEYQKTINYLTSRKELVNSFVKIMPALKDFTENKSPEEFKKSLTELGNNINELQPLKDNKIIMPSAIFGNLGEDIIGLYKYFEIRYISKTLVKTLEKIKELFEKESEMYSVITGERNIKSLVVVNYMIDNEMVIPWSLVESAPITMGLELSVDKKPAKDDKTKKALKKVLEVRYFRMNYLLKSAEGDIKILLADLIKNYNDFIKGNKLVFDNIAYIANRASGYFADINKYKDVITGKTNYYPDTEIIYHGNSDTKVFHQPNCAYYFSKNSNIMFYAREEAISKGYSPCSVCKP
jgi:hypothetical protein